MIFLWDPENGNNNIFDYMEMTDGYAKVSLIINIVWSISCYGII
jgi:hypothetical protein